MSNRFIQYLAYMIVFTVITLLLLEISLRLVPGALPATILIRFNEELREEIATERGFMTENLTVAIERDDNGPELRILKPYAEISYPDVFAFANDPGAVLDGTMDEVGFCNPSGLYTGTDVFEIVTIGDSLTWCHTVRAEDTFSWLLADNSGHSVYNLGKGGIGLYEYVQILKTFGIRKDPKIVIMNVYEGNDLRDALEYREAVRKRDQDARSDGLSAVGLRDAIRNSFVGRHSYAINLLIGGASYMYSYFAYPDERAGQSIDFSYVVSLADGPVDFNSQNVDVDEVVHARRLQDGTIDLDIFTSALQSFVALSQERNFTPIVTYIPSAHSAYAQMLEFSDPDIERPMLQFSAAMRTFFADKARELGYEFIDFTPDMQAAAQQGDADNLLYFPTNLHLTRPGHEVIASRLASALPMLAKTAETADE